MPVNNPEESIQARMYSLAQDRDGWRTPTREVFILLAEGILIKQLHVSTDMWSPSGNTLIT
jgi:hypothetical protein